MRTIIFKHIKHINTDDLSYMTQINTLPDLDEDEDHDRIYDQNSMFINDPIKIEKLRKILNELEDSGANYVSIFHHTDHNEYELDGIHVKEASQEDIDTEANIAKEKELKKLNDQLANIEKTADNFREQIRKINESKF